MPVGDSPSDVLSARMDLVADAFRRFNAHPVAERWASFLREGTSHTLTVDLHEPRCVGFVAVGRPSFADINLTVSNVAGIAIGRDGREDAHPYVRYCPTTPSRVYVTVSAVHGTGEVGVMTLIDASAVAPALDDVLGVRPSAQMAGPRTPRASIGADPAQASAIESLRRTLARLPQDTYLPVGEIHSGTLPGQHSAVEPVALQAGHCYVVMAAGGPNVDDLDLVVGGPDRQALGHDVGMDAHPSVRVCPWTNGQHPVEVRMFAGSGQWAMSVVEIRPSEPALPSDIVGVERARAMEIAGDAVRRGFTPMGPPLRGAPWGHAPMIYPIQLRAGRCYLMGAAASDVLTPIEAWLSDATGAVSAADTAERERAVIYHCADRDQRATVTVRAPNGRGEYVYEAFESMGRGH